MVIMTTALAAPAAIDTVSTSDLNEEAVQVNINDVYECLVSRKVYANSNSMKALIRIHPAAAYAPILSDKAMCGHDQAFGRVLVELLKWRWIDILGYTTVSPIYGLQYHSPSTVWERTIIARCKHACAG